MGSRLAHTAAGPAWLAGRAQSHPGSLECAEKVYLATLAQGSTLTSAVLTLGRSPSRREEHWAACMVVKRVGLPGAGLLETKAQSVALSLGQCGNEDVKGQA